MKIKPSYVAVFLLATLSAVFVYIKTPKAQNTVPEINEVIKNDIPTNTPDIVIIDDSNVIPFETVQENSDNPLNKKEPQPIIQDAEWANKAGFYEIEKWKASRGQFSEEDMQEYYSYDTNTLNQLADNGDLKALHTLGWQAFSEGKVSDVKKHYRTAAVYGSTLSLGIFSNLEESKFSLKKDLRDPKVWQHVIKAFAYKQVAVLRGDKEYLMHASMSEKRFNLDFTLSERREIDRLAEDIYSQLERERDAIGLDPFDNSVPPIVDKYFTDINKNNSEKNIVR